MVVVPDGETPMDATPMDATPIDAQAPPEVGEFELGFLLGILAGEGHFGGDGRQPEVTLRMHTRHERLFRWLQHAFPGGRLYGPYHHGGRDYYQWMARGEYLRRTLVPLIAGRLDDLDSYAAGRFARMCHNYAIELPAPAPPATSAYSS
jgi:hypothetical protein